jgi:type II secretory pathway component HofQ
MPESNAAAKKRQQKANRAMGLGDEQGRMVRMKDPPKLMLCTVCQQEMKVTKTNTELTMHSESKHNSTLEECFPGAAALAAELIAAAGKKAADASSNSGGATKAQSKAKDKAGLDDLLNAGLAPKKGKK